jgi:MazG family protein
MTQPESRPIDQLLAVMARLRHPTEGCPWDREQNYCSIVPHTIEEAYEVADAIEQNDMLSLKDELGDLLFQVVYYAQMASEDQHFTFDDVARAIVDKMVSRHPHVFGADSVATAAAQTVHWEAQKAAERQARAQMSAHSMAWHAGCLR